MSEAEKQSVIANAKKLASDSKMAKKAIKNNDIDPDGWFDTYRSMRGIPYMARIIWNLVNLGYADSYYSEDDKFLKIDKDNKLLTYNFDGEEKSEELKIEKKSKIKYLTISSKKYVLLNSNEICVLIDELGNLLFQGNFYHSILEKRYRAKSVFEATSFLNDGKRLIFQNI